MAKKKETKDAEGFIEIPFGAFDSETIGWTYTIPEGFTAKIEDGKIIVEKAEGDDEGIRKELLKVIRHCYEDGGYALCTDDYKKYSSYLENLKEQKPIPIFKIGDKIKLKFESKYPYREIVAIKDGAYYFDRLVHLPFERQEDWEKEQQSTKQDEGDEEIRKSLVEFFGKFKPQDMWNEMISFGDILAYLEKQKDASTRHISPTEAWDMLKETFTKMLINYQKSNIPITDENINAELDMFYPIMEKAIISIITAAGDDESIMREFYHRGYEDGRLATRKVQKPTEWSEEDEIKLASLINYFEGDALDCSTEDMVRWLKSLRPQPHWKPSEEQMEMLSYVMENRDDHCGDVLRSLYNDIKKL